MNYSLKSPEFFRYEGSLIPKWKLPPINIFIQNTLSRKKSNNGKTDKVEFIFLETNIKSKGELKYFIILISKLAIKKLRMN